MNFIIVNGEKQSTHSSCISAYDRGLTLGHGLFETILIKSGAAPLLDYHWNRLIISAKRLDIKPPFNFNEFLTMINVLIHDNKLTHSNACIRLTVTDGVSERGLLSTSNQSPTYFITSCSLPETSKKPMTATLVTTRRNEYSQACSIKSISCLDNILAKKEAVSKGFDEAFILNSKLNLAEGAISNVFIVKNGIVYTPPLIDGAMPGVVRHVLLNKLTLNNIRFKEEPITTKMLYDADEIFISNALLGIKSICKLDNYILYGPFKTTELVSSSFKSQFNYV